MPDIFHNVYIHESPEKVFHAISKGEEIEKWWTKRSSGKAIVGEVFNLYFSDDYDWKAKLISVAENEKCKWQMLKADKDWIHTRFGFQLFKRNNITLAEFSHVGWPEINEHYKRSNYCWAMYLQLLKWYVETGNTTIFEERTFV